MTRVVSSRPGAGAERVDQVAGELVRHRLQPDLLGDGAHGALGGVDEAVQELRRVHRMRREMRG
jgi:dipeptidase E